MLKALPLVVQLRQFLAAIAITAQLSTGKDVALPPKQL